MENKKSSGLAIAGCMFIGMGVGLLFASVLNRGKGGVQG